MNVKKSRLAALLLALVVSVSACGGGADETSADTDTQSDAAPSPDEGAAGAEPTGDVDPGESAPEGNGVILADLCAGNQPLNGAVSLDDLVSYGILSSPNATVESNSAYDASTYNTFGFICNITEDVGDGENGLTIGMNSGPETFQLAIEQGDAPIEKMGEWDVIVGSNWLSPIAMRGTDSAGKKHSLYVTWTPADGSIPDAATLERVMRPFATALAEGSTLDIPQG